MIRLTLQERKVFLFVSFLFLFGLAASFFKKENECDVCMISPKANMPLGAVNINTATRDELIGLSGIGPKMADDIIARRAVQGGFKNVDELKQIKGISDKKLDLLKANLYVE